MHTETEEVLEEEWLLSELNEAQENAVSMFDEDVRGDFREAERSRMTLDVDVEAGRGRENDHPVLKYNINNKGPKQIRELHNTAVSVASDSPQLEVTKEFYDQGGGGASTIHIKIV